MLVRPFGFRRTYERVLQRDTNVGTGILGGCRCGSRNDERTVKDRRDDTLSALRGHHDDQHDRADTCRAHVHESHFCLFRVRPLGGVQVQEEGRRLVSRFRSSHHCAAHSFANFGIEGH